MRLKIRRHLFWLCTKSSDLIFQSIQSAGNYVAEEMMEMKEKGGYEEGFFEGLAKIERTRDDKFTVTTVTNEMWKFATLRLWELNDEIKEKQKKVDERIVAYKKEKELKSQ